MSSVCSKFKKIKYKGKKGEEKWIKIIILESMKLSANCCFQMDHV